MNFKEFLRKQLLIFVVLYTCIGLAMGLTGNLFDSDRQFTYSAFFYPLIYAALYLLLQFISYSKKELTAKQYCFRCFLQFITYEAIVLAYTICITDASMQVYLVLALCIPLITVLSNIIIWFLDVKKAKELKKELLIYQKQHLQDKS